MSIDVRWGSATHRGRIRDRNEDAVLAGPDVFAVADGMGGHAGGQVASALAVAHLAAIRGLADAEDPGSVVRHGLLGANRAIRERGATDPAVAGLGTTVAGIARTPDARVVVFHVGDSRVYRLRAGVLEQLTEDHSVVGELIRAGEISPAEARHHPHRSVVTRALGVVDAVDPVVRTVAVEVGDAFLVASDGLCNEVDDAALGAILGAPGTADERARRLVDAALDGGGRDNVSVVVVAVAGTRGGDHLDVDTTPSHHATAG